MVVSVDTVKSNPRKTSKPRWLLAFNCQAIGLGNCLSLMSNEFELECHTANSFRKNIDSLSRDLHRYERILIAPQLLSCLEPDARNSQNIWKVPVLHFPAYHPDACYLQDASGKSVKGPLGDYHSLIALAAFQLELSVQKACTLFREDVYTALGYFDRWHLSRAHLLKLFSEHGLDLSSRFVNWSRHGAFMYTVNHPRIHCLHDLAHVILENAGIKAKYLDAIPHDNLANGPIYPVYPELAAQLGIQGSYLFKQSGYHGVFELQDFLAASFNTYQALQLGDMTPRLEAALAATRSVLEAEL
jgi:hypothetical protein